MLINAVALKLPDFWESSASAWFAQTEAQFALREITTDAMKYYYVVSALENSTATRVASFLTNPPEEEKYKTFKTHLLKAFQLSDTERASRLFSIQGLGDNKLSELVEMQRPAVSSGHELWPYRQTAIHQRQHLWSGAPV